MKANGDIDEQTKNRCDKAVDLYKQGAVRKIYLTVWITCNTFPMARSMQEYLTANGVPEDKIQLEPRGMNTAGEMDVFLSCVPKTHKIMFISTWYHIPRIIWLALWRVLPNRFSVAAAWKHAHFKGDVLMEFLKIANAILRPYRSAKVMDIRFQL